VVQGSNVVVGADHAVYIFWLDGNASSQRIEMRKSTNLGRTFGSTSTVATLATTGTNGDLGLDFRTNAFPQAYTDPANSQNIYLVYNDKGVASGDRGDIFFTQSNNGGTSWSTPVKVNDDTGTADQFMPAIAVTPDGTHLFITWYDRRNSGPGNGNIDRFGTIGSISGSTVTFTANFQINDVSFPEVFGQDPAIVSNYMGDYDQAAATNTNFYTTWGDNRLADSSHANNPDVRFAAVSVNTTRPLGLVVHGTPGPDSDGAAAATLQAAPPSFADLGHFLVPPPAASTGSGDTHSGSSGLHGTVVDQVFASAKGTPAPTPIGLSGAGQGSSSDGALGDVPVWKAPTL
jgi:hypothetical protein